MRDVGRADAIAVRDGGEALDVYAEHPREHLGLDFAELREPLGDVRDRTMMLAKLLTDRRRQCRGDITVIGQCSGQGLGRRRFRSRFGDIVPIAILDGSDTRLRESGDRVRSSGFGQELERRVGEIVVCGVEVCASRRRSRRRHERDGHVPEPRTPAAPEHRRDRWRAARRDGDGCPPGSGRGAWPTRRRSTGHT